MRLSLPPKPERANDEGDEKAYPRVREDLMT